MKRDRTDRLTDRDRQTDTHTNRENDCSHCCVVIENCSTTYLFATNFPRFYKTFSSGNNFFGFFVVGHAVQKIKLNNLRIAS